MAQVAPHSESPYRDMMNRRLLRQTYAPVCLTASRVREREFKLKFKSHPHPEQDSAAPAGALPGDAR